MNKKSGFKTQKKKTFCSLGTFVFKHLSNWPQCVSSAPFSQSFSLSHVQLIGMQRPLGQAKKLTGHFSFLLSAEKKPKQEKKCHIIKHFKRVKRKLSLKKGQTWTISFIWEVPTVVGPVAHPGGEVAQGGPLAALKLSLFNSKAEEAGAICRFWWRRDRRFRFKAILFMQLDHTAWNIYFSSSLPFGCSL